MTTNTRITKINGIVSECEGLLKSLCVCFGRTFCFIAFVAVVLFDFRELKVEGLSNGGPVQTTNKTKNKKPCVTSGLLANSGDPFQLFHGMRKVSIKTEGGQNYVEQRYDAQGAKKSEIICRTNFLLWAGEGKVILEFTGCVGERGGALER